MAHEIEGVGNVEIGADPLAKAEMTASLIRQDVKTGTAEPLGAHVKYEDHPGPDRGPTAWKTPSTLNKTGKGNCNSIVRAAAHGIEVEPGGEVVKPDASHVAVVPVPQKDGTRVDHEFLLASPKPGDKPLNIDGAGKVVGEIPAERIIDPNVLKGANGGKSLPPEVYQGASVTPIYPPHVKDLSHVTAPPADRAAEGNAYQGVERAHAPQTPEGVKVAEVSHLAARLVTPPAEHEPRPLKELYPTHHPVLDEAGKSVIAAEAAGKRMLGFKPTIRMVEEYRDGLNAIAKGKNPAPLPSDPKLTQEHIDAARGLHDHLLDLAGAQRAPEHGGPDAKSVDALAEHARSLKDGDRAEPDHDVRAVQTAEIDAIIPGAVPDGLRQHLPSRAPAPAAPSRRVRLPTMARMYDDAVLLPLYVDGDREEDLGVMGSAMWLTLSEALDAWCCGHPHDGRRRAPPARQIDPRLGAVDWANASRAAAKEAEVANRQAERVAITAAQGGIGGGGGGGGHWHDDRWRDRDRGRDDGRGRDRGRDRDDGRRALLWSAEGWRGRERARLSERAPMHDEPTRDSRKILTLDPGEEVFILENRGEWLSVEGRGRRGWVKRSHVDEDARLGGWGDWRGWGRRWDRAIPDRAFVDEARFRRAYDAALNLPMARQRLLSGETVQGYDLPHLQVGAKIRGLTLPSALANEDTLATAEQIAADPRLAGIGLAGIGLAGIGGGHGGGGGGGHWHHGHHGGGWGGGGWGPAFVEPVYAPQCVDPTDPADPCYDPSLSGVGNPAEAEILTEVKAHRAATEGGPPAGGARRIQFPPWVERQGDAIGDMAAALRAALAPGRGPAPCGPCGG